MNIKCPVPRVGAICRIKPKEQLPRTGRRGPLHEHLVDARNTNGNVSITGLAKSRMFTLAKKHEPLAAMSASVLLEESPAQSRADNWQLEL